MEAIYLDPTVCGYFDVPYRNTHEWACSADAIYNSRPSWDSTHTQFLKVVEQADLSGSPLVRDFGRAGLAASSLEFETVEGLVVADGDVTGDGVRDISLELPGRPVAYELPDPDAEEGWEALLLDQQVAWPITNSDTLLKVDFATGALDALIE